MYWCQVNREKLLRYLPSGGVVAEVGTYEGAYAETIARTCNPAKLFLIDKWDFSDPAYQAQAQTYPNRDGQAVLASIHKNFGARIAAGQVQIIRADSLAAAAQLGPGTFDWIYVDCDHRYEAVLADLKAYSRLLKPDGLLLGHDFEEPTFEVAARMNFGVTEAVREFLRKSDFEMLLMSAGFWATYCLTRNPGGAIAKGIVSSILADGAAIVDMGEIDRLRFHWDSMTVGGKTLRYRRVEIVE